MAIRGRGWWLAGFTAGWVAVAACSGSSNNGSGDGGVPITPADASAPDATVDVADAETPGADASAPVDAAAPGTDAAVDYFGKPGPWPTDAMTAYLQSEATEIIDVSTDEAQNIWAVSRSALYLLQPGQTQFKKFTGADGLHLSNAESPGITAVAGGAAGEAFVGYQGTEVRNAQFDADKDRGKLDRVRLKADGTLQVTFFAIRNNDALNHMAKDCQPLRLPDGGIDPNDTDWSYSEDRTAMRMVYDHLYHRGSLYVGYQHGVGRIDSGKPDKLTGQEWADHVHPQVINANGTPRQGEWRALALDPSNRGGNTGVLWMGGRWTAGAIDWTPSLFEWTNNNYDCPPEYPKHNLLVAFSNSRAGVTDVRPVFNVNSGDSIYLHGIAPLSDGTVYFASGQGYDSQYGGPFGVAMWQGGANWTYLSPGGDLGLSSSGIVDMQRAPDDTILFVLDDGSLWRWNPNPKPRGVNLGRITGLPAGATRVYVDAMTDPPGVYVATYRGFALVRLPAKP
ncbi:MAG: hypothetical protein QM765_19650 [Myxococcales bacterium]